MIEPGLIELAALVPPESFDAASEAARAELADQGGGRLQRAMTGLIGPRVAAAMDAKLKQLDLLPLFIKGWGKSPELAAEAKASEAEQTTRVVRLGKLEQDLDLYPILGISGFGITASPIQFTLTLKAEFEAIEVGFEQGYVVQIGGGLCRLAAVLKLGQLSFPSGFDPVEWQVGKGRRFEAPGLAILPK
jgi:hypothetical protein